MVYLKRVHEGAEGKIACKLEIMEPCCSVKDRRVCRNATACVCVRPYGVCLRARARAPAASGASPRPPKPTQ
jgi:hypothetical protein